MHASRIIVAGLWIVLLSVGPFVQAQSKDAPKSPLKDPAKTAKKDPPPIPIALQLQSERGSAIYKLGEPASFLYRTNTSGDIEYKLTEDGFKVLSEGKLRAEAGQTYKFDHDAKTPGFFRLELKLGPATAQAAVAVEPTKITPTAKVPDDFEEFWKTQLDELAKVRVDPVVEKWPSESTSRVDVYRVNLASVDDRRVYGWLAIPKGEGPFPAILTVPYAGVYGIKPDVAQAELGAVTMNIIIHDFPVNHPAEFYKKEAETTLKDYNRIGWDDKTASYYRWAALAGVRAIDFLSTRKEVDPKQIAVTGTSQGGALTLIVSGLDQRVGFAAPNVAGMCDLNARSQDRIDGWPHWLASAPKELKEKVEATSQYFDAVNFARKFKGKSVHGVGFLDVVCPPSTVYAAFNVHPEPKVMINSPTMGHSTDPRWLRAREDFWKENLTLKPPPTPPAPPKKKK